MVEITKLNGKKISLNCDLVEFIESNPDTTITLTTGRIIIARDSVDEIVSKVIEFRRQCFKGIAEYLTLGDNGTTK